MDPDPWICNSGQRIRKSEFWIRNTETLRGVWSPGFLTDEVYLLFFILTGRHEALRDRTGGEGAKGAERRELRPGYLSGLIFILICTVMLGFLALLAHDNSCILDVHWDPFNHLHTSNMKVLGTKDTFELKFTGQKCRFIIMASLLNCLCHLHGN